MNLCLDCIDILGGCKVACEIHEDCNSFSYDSSTKECDLSRRNCSVARVQATETGI